MYQVERRCVILVAPIWICFLMIVSKYGRFLSNSELDILTMLPNSQNGTSLKRFTPSRHRTNTLNLLNTQDYDYVNREKNMFNLHKQANINVVYNREDTTPERTRNLPFLKNYRSPCWQEMNESKNGSRIRCLPYFFLVGAPKCGTTDLRKRLGGHPLTVPIKMYQWLSRTRFNGKVGRLSNYLGMFDKAVESNISRNEKNNYHPLVFGDYSVSLLWDNRRLLKDFKNRTMTTPPFTNADIIHNLNPDAKILIILRNPIKRLYSEYLYFKKSNKSVENFHQAVVSSIHQHTNCSQRYGLRYCAYFLRALLRIQIGFYHIFIEDYFRVFVREQIKIIKLEDHSQRMADSMTEIFTFLDIGIPSKEELAQISEQNHSNRRKKADRDLGDMLPDTRIHLENFYKPYNERLVKLLGNTFRYY